MEVMRELMEIGMKEGIGVEMNTPAFCWRIKEDFTEEEINGLIEYIIRKTNEVEKQMLFKVITKEKTMLSYLYYIY